MTDTSSLDYWLNVAAWDLLDISDDGDVLAAADTPGTKQLFLAAPQRRRQLTALSDPCTGRFIVGEPAVVVQHDTNGDGCFTLSRLDLSDAAAAPAASTALQPLADHPQAAEFLMDTGPGWIAYMTNRRNGADFDVVLRHLASGAEKDIYTMGGHVSEVAIQTDPADPLRNPVAAVSIFTTEGLSTHLLLVTADATNMLSHPHYLGIHTSISISPGMRGIIASSDASSERLEVRRFELGSDPITLVHDRDRDVYAIPSPDGQLLAVMHSHCGRTQLTINGPAGDLKKEFELPPAGDAEVKWSPSSQWLAIHLNTAYSPSEIYRVHRSDWQLELVISSDQHHEVRNTRSVSYPDYLEIPTRDGHAIPCHIYRPRHIDVASPAVIYLHGGPQAHELETFSPLKQHLTDAGFIVVAPDVRGSTGYGKTWYQLDDRRLRMNAVADLADIHAWLPRLNIDPRRTALAGASYGGYLTLCGLVFQPELWAAGVDVMGISSLVSYLENTAPYLQKVSESEFGSLDHDRDFLIEASPLYRATHVRAPLLIIHGANDPRVPLQESQDFAAAVQQAGGDCSLTVFADEGHGLSHQGNRHTAYAQIAQFLHTHLPKYQPEPTH